VTSCVSKRNPVYRPAGRLPTLATISMRCIERGERRGSFGGQVNAAHRLGRERPATTQELIHKVPHQEMFGLTVGKSRPICSEADSLRRREPPPSQFGGGEGYLSSRIMGCLG
jgi:hypothetical protein